MSKQFYNRISDNECPAKTKSFRNESLNPQFENFFKKEEIHYLSLFFLVRKLQEINNLSQ